MLCIPVQSFLGAGLLSVLQLLSLENTRDRVLRVGERDGGTGCRTTWHAASS